jgi:lysophospholipase L1-like esterase
VFLPGATEEHPNRAGYSVMARAALETIRREGWLSR